MTLYTVKPLDDFTIFTTPSAQRKPILFKATWTRTIKDLTYELGYLDGTDVILELAVQSNKIRLDGMLKADAKVTHPGVRMSFQSRHGALSYTCDTYEARYYGQMPDWQANVRAIGLTLEALRTVDRYGATKGEQYSGFKALPAGSGGIALGGITRDEAARVLSRWSGTTIDTDESEASARARWREARSNTHPDRRDGDQTAWDDVEQAAKVLGLS